MPSSCPHGERVYKEGIKGNKTWRAEFCGLPKGTYGACEPVWLKGDEAPASSPTGANQAVDLLGLILSTLQEMNRTLSMMYAKESLRGGPTPTLPVPPYVPGFVTTPGTTTNTAPMPTGQYFAPTASQPTPEDNVNPADIPF